VGGGTKVGGRGDKRKTTNPHTGGRFHRIDVRGWGGGEEARETHQRKGGVLWNNKKGTIKKKKRTPQKVGIRVENNRPGKGKGSKEKKKKMF